MPSLSAFGAPLAPIAYVPTIANTEVVAIFGEGFTITKPQPTRPTLSAYLSPA